MSVSCPPCGLQCVVEPQCASHSRIQICRCLRRCVSSCQAAVCEIEGGRSEALAFAASLSHRYHVTFISGRSNCRQLLPKLAWTPLQMHKMDIYLR